MWFELLNLAQASPTISVHIQTSGSAATTDVWNLVSLAGVFVLLLIAWGCSTDRRRMNWRVIGWGIGLQFLIAALIFTTTPSRMVFNGLNNSVVQIINAASEGQRFLFGPLAEPPGVEGSVGFVLAFQALPLIVTFAALMRLLYHVGVMGRLVRGFAWVFSQFMRISGAESLCASANIFVGIESATTIRPYLAKMTRSELGLVLTVGMATVASSVLGLYVFQLQAVFPQIAGHLIAASLLSAPAAIVMAKIILPELGEPETLGVHVPAYKEDDATWIEAIINGAMAGLKMVVAIAALLIAFVGLVGIVNELLVHVGVWLGMGETLSLQWLFGWVFAPLALAMGVPPVDATAVGQLLGERLVLTEVVAFPHLGEMMRGEGLVYQRSAIIAAYALCGFAHIASLAIYIGGIAALVPERRTELAKLGPRALLAATLACCLTGAVAGVFMHEGMLRLGS